MTKFGLGKIFITSIETLLKDQLLWIINGGTTTQCFNVETGARKGDIKGLEIFEHCFLYTAYAGDTTFRKIQNTLHTRLKYLIPIFTLYIYI